MIKDKVTFGTSSTMFVHLSQHIAVALGDDGQPDRMLADPVAYDGEKILGGASELKKILPRDRFVEELKEMQRNIIAINQNGIGWYYEQETLPYSVVKGDEQPKPVSDETLEDLQRLSNRVSAVEDVLSQQRDKLSETVSHLDEQLKLQSAAIESLKKQSPVQIVLPGAPEGVIVKGLRHEMFEPVLRRVQAGIHVFLTGPAGCGKSHMCKQISEALNVPFYFQNAVTNTYDITGFKDAGGIYHPTEFFKAFSEGGVFLLDEVDASSPDVLTVLNAALANQYFPFPDKPEPTMQHENFRCVAAGNTFGTGADLQYVGRTQLDAATLDRFDIVPVGYSPAIEKALLGDDMWVFADEWRKQCNEMKNMHICSTRALIDIKKLEAIGIPLQVAIKTRLVKEMPKQDYERLQTKVMGSGRLDKKWGNALVMLRNNYDRVA